MAYKFDISQLNPLKFYPLSDSIVTFPDIITPSPLIADDLNSLAVFNANYNTRDFDADFFARNIPKYDQQRKYCQPFQQGDKIRVQFLGIPNYVVLSTPVNPYTAFIINSESGQVLSQMQPSQGTQIGSEYLREVVFDLFAIPEGHYYVLIQCREEQGGGTLYTRTYVISEPIHVAQTHKETMLFEYENSYNAQGIIFEQLGDKFQFRVHSALTELTPDSKFTTYEDEPLNLEMLSGTPFRLWTLGIGGNGNAIPQWIADKIERITLCDTFKIDGKDYTRNEGAKLEANRKQRTPLFSWKITLRERINDDSVYVDEETTNIFLGQKVVEGEEYIFVGTLTRPASSNIVINRFFNGYTGALQYLNSINANGIFGIDANNKVVFRPANSTIATAYAGATLEILPYVLRFGITTDFANDVLSIALTPSGTTTYAIQYRYGGAITKASTAISINLTFGYNPEENAECLLAVDKATFIALGISSENVVSSLSGYFPPQTTDIVFNGYSIKNIGINLFKYCTNALTQINFQNTLIGKEGIDKILKYCFLSDAVTICDLYLTQTPATPCSDDVAKNIVPYLRAKGMNIYLDSQYLPAPPVNISAPAITGTFQPAFYITCSNGTWTGYPTPSYERVWEYSTNGGTTWNLFSPSETGTQYLVQSGDVGRLIRCKVTALNSQGTDFVYSNSVLITSVGSAPYPTVLPVISGGPALGSVLTTTNGSWSGTPTITFAYQWLRNGGAIGLANASTYTTVSADLGQNIQCQVTATNGSGANTGESNIINPTQSPANTLAPLVTGATTSGSILSAFVGTWSGFPVPTYTYNWQRSTDNGATWSNYSPTQTGSTYTLVSGDVGNDVRCQVIASNGIGSPVTANSNQVDIPAPTLQRPINSVLPAITANVPSNTGDFYVGQVLTCSTGTWLNSPTGYAYQWQRNGANISGATTNTYTLATNATPSLADEGKDITCIVTATNAGGSEPQVSNSILCLDADFFAVLSRAFVLSFTRPNAAGARHLNAFAIDLKLNGFWSQLDVLYVFINNGSSNFSLLNWKTPNNHQCTLTNAPTWTSNGGFTLNGSSQSIDTNFNPSVSGVNYTLNNAGRYAFCRRTVGTAGSRIDGNTVALNDNSMVISSSSQTNTINSGTTLPAVAASTFVSGLHAIMRTSSTAATRAYDLSVAVNATSTSVPNSNQLIGRSLTTHGAGFSIQLYAMGASFVADIPTFRSLLEKYLNNMP